MDIEQTRAYCLTQKGCTESFPFDDESLVFKVGGRIFAILGLTPPFSINLKGDPRVNIQLRELHEWIVPGYHMNKQHWNTVYLETGMNDSLIREMIDNSYSLVINKLPKSARECL
jgi:predicted DNA-binding protein (MmcQ/YjbR family)